MEKLIFLILAVSILIFVLYLGATAIMTGFKAKGNAPNKDERRDDHPQDTSSSLDGNTNLSDEIAKLNELLKSGVLTQEEFDKAKQKLLDN
jgi:flagellar basal body-associated protein FliL